MRLLVAILVTMAVAIGAGIFLRGHPGVFILSFGETTFQASFAFFIAAVLFITLSLFLVFVVISNLVNMPGKYRRWNRHRTQLRAEQFLTRGLLNTYEGNWRRAEEAFRKGARYSSNPLLNYLGAARSAQHLGDVQQRDHYLRLAHACSTDSSFVVGLTQAELQLDEDQLEQAYATLRHLQGKGSGQDQANLMLLKTCSDLEEWQEVLEMLGKLRKSGVLRPEEVKAKQLQAYAGMLLKAGGSGDRGALEEVWKTVPGKLQKELYLLEVYINQRLHFPDTQDCEGLLKNVLKHQWDQALARLYGLVRGDDISRQLAFAEGLLKSHARDPVLLLTVGRLSRANSLWGKARSCLEESLEVQPGPEACQEMATLLEQQGDFAAAAEYYQKGLNLATGVTSANKDVNRKLG